MLRVAGLAVLMGAVGSVCAAESAVYWGLSDASAAVALDAAHFIAADDETNVLKIYQIAMPSGPVGQVDLSDFLECGDPHPEADIEGAARIGKRIYWITSHGRNKDGKERPGRYALFATDCVARADAAPTVVPVGRPYRHLAADLSGRTRLGFLGLAAAIRLGESLSKDERLALAPKENGLNIEGLAAGPDGTLLIGLRNPVYRDPDNGKEMAIVLTLTNPEAMVMQGTAAAFGSPILLDLDGLGVRSLERIDRPNGSAKYLIAAGPANSKNRFAFYIWDGPKGNALRQMPVTLPEEFSPEAMFQVPQTESVWVLSDDGTLETTVSSPAECLEGERLKNGKCPNKFLVDVNRRTFRALSIPFSGIP